MRAGRKRRQLAIERRDADRRKAEDRRRGGADDSVMEDDAEDATGRPEEAEKTGELEEPERAAAELANPDLAAADLETLGRELEKSITGGVHTTSNSVSAPSAPPGLNATPED